MQIQPQLLTALLEIRQMLKSNRNANEAIIRQAIVLRILSIMGFDIWNVNEVSPEITNKGSYRADIIVRHRKGSFIIEIKGAGISFTTKDYAQAGNYLGIEGICFAVLTNGIQWTFLDERMPNRYDERIIFSLNLETMPIEEFGKYLSMALNHNVWKDDLFSLQMHLISSEIKLGKSNISLHEDSVKDNPNKIFMRTYAVGTTAYAIYDLVDQSWTILAGSTALSRFMNYERTGEKFLRDRQNLIESGVMVLRDDSLYVFTQDVRVESASRAARYIVGVHRNGWDMWKDSEGRSALHYKPKGKLANYNLSKIQAPARKTET